MFYFRLSPFTCSLQLTTCGRCLPYGHGGRTRVGKHRAPPGARAEMEREDARPASHMADGSLRRMMPTLSYTGDLHTEGDSKG